MKIESYSFGKIVIDGVKYSSDIIIYPDRVDSSWWRKQSHYVNMEDIPQIFKENPDIIIFGTGSYGLMKIDEEAKNEFAKRNIELIIENTGQAVQTYNNLSKDKNIIAALHLTC